MASWSCLILYWAFNQAWLNSTNPPLSFFTSGFRLLANPFGSCDSIGVALVRIARLADAAVEIHALRLLDDVRGLVRGGVKIGRAIEHHVVAGRIRVCAHRPRAVAADVRLDPRHVVVGAERRLD